MYIYIYFFFLQWRTQEFCSGEWGGSTNSVHRGQRERGSGGGNPLVRCSGGSCNLVQKMSFHIVVFFFYFWYFKTICDDNLFVIANVKQLRT